MINLLPIENQINIRRIYKRRLLNVFIFFLSFLVLASAVILLPSYIIFQAKINDVKSRLGEFSADDKRLTDEGIVKIHALRSKVNMIFPAVSKSVYVTDRLNQILNLRPDGLSITDISILDQKSFSLRGTAKSRQDVISFVNSLEALQSVVDVNSPVSNLIAEHNGTFVITFAFQN